MSSRTLNYLSCLNITSKLRLMFRNNKYYRSVSIFLDILLLVILIIIVLFSIRTLFYQSILIEWDHPYHFYETYLMYHYFIPSMSLIGYDPYSNLGIIFIQYVFNYLIVSLLTLVTEI